jgi:hypothetical protein
MMKTVSRALPGAFLAAGLLAASSANAGTVVLSGTAPSTDLLASSTDASGTPEGSRDYTDNGAPLGVGQSFTVGSASTFSAFTLLGAGGSDGRADPVVFTLSFGTFADGNFTASFSDTASIARSEVNSNATDGDYITFTLSVPQALVPGVTYAAFLSNNAENNTAYIGTDVSSTDVYAGGAALTGGTVAANGSYDRVFFVQGEAIPEPSSLLLGVTCGIGMLGMRGRRAQ